MSNSSSLPRGVQLPLELRPNKRRRKPRSRVFQETTSLLLLIAGAFLVAFSFNMFLLPNKIASGGVSGISVIVNALFAIPPAYTQWVLNIPLFIAGIFVFGSRFGVKTAVGSVVLPLFVLLTAHWTPPTQNPLLAAIYGGLGVGIGLGLVFRGRASTGGLDVAAQIIHRLTGLTLGIAVATLDGLVILSAGILISPENALYALIGLFVTSKTIDVVQTGLQTSKAAFIVTSQPEKVSQAVLIDLDRGLTKLQGEGGYTGEQRPVLLTVVGQNEVSRLKALVREADPGAFVIITSAAEVLGEGFHDHPLNK
ncbi:YitT family protein [Cohnella sp. REN36]|uniref:YitT family protein n=1 Tax=Cohnella sp. REN36 TaxID=2887347 RepID=UPI001D138DE5|nr:YitT family protein [Cohnella sp. REN36]MCC3374056.1 YitT family protein [Cohnella sp. REN36]